jgi:hypothetical protein
LTDFSISSRRLCLTSSGGADRIANLLGLFHKIGKSCFYTHGKNLQAALRGGLMTSVPVRVCAEIIRPIGQGQKPQRKTQQGNRVKK